MRGEMFRIAQIGTLRILVSVPQENAPAVKVGQPATVLVAEFAKRRFQGKVARTANSLDMNTRTMLTEVQLSNPDGALLPGMYGQVTLNFPVPHKVIEIPTTALYSDAQGLRVGVVDAQQRLHYQAITIERDAGAALQIATGLTGDERIIKIAVPWLVEGDPLELSSAPAAAGLGAQPGPKSP